MRRLLLIATGLMLGAGALPAGEYDPIMQGYIENEVSRWISDPVLIGAVIAQNQRTAGYTQAEIDALDASWASQMNQTRKPLIDQVILNPAADFLRDQLTRSGGVISELILMDHLGLNVATSDVTSDYWQGDEAKFTETYPHGANAMHFGDVAFDESAQGYVGQASVSVTDPASGRVIGALTIGLNAEMLF